MERFVETIRNGGKVYGCFEQDVLIGYVTLDVKIFGKKVKYVLLDQLFVSNNYRNHGIGRKLVELCCVQAKSWGAERIYLCAGSAENTISFYNKMGFRNAEEINQALYEEDPNDIQLEYCL